MTDQIEVDYEALFEGIQAQTYREGDTDLGVELPCGLGAKPVRLLNGRLTSEIDLQPSVDGVRSPGPAHVVVHKNGGCTIPEMWRAKMSPADIEIVSALALNMAKHPRTTF